MQWNIGQDVPFNPEHMSHRRIFETPELMINLFGFSQGQVLPNHKTSSTAIIQVLTGLMTVSAAGEDHVLEAGATITLEPNQEHSLRASEPSVVQLILTPHPQYHTLADKIGLGVPPKTP